MTTKQIIATIESRRKELGYSQQRLAEQCGMLRESYARIAAGNSTPSLTTLQKLCKALHLEVRVESRHVMLHIADDEPAQIAGLISESDSFVE